MFLEDCGYLSERCQLAIIELHEMEWNRQHYSVSEVAELAERIDGFKRIASARAVYVYVNERFDTHVEKGSR